MGSLLLGLYDDEGRCSTSASRRASRRRSGASWSSFLAPYRENALGVAPLGGTGPGARGRARRAAQRMPGGKSRWSQGKDLSWEPLRPELVVAGGLRSHAGLALPSHGAVSPLARPTRAPRDCTYAQLEVVPPQELAAIFAAAGIERVRSSSPPFAPPSARVCAWRVRRAIARRIVVRDPASPAAGAALPGTCRRFTRTRVHVDERPRIESTSTSSIARCAAASGCRAFQRSRPAERRRPCPANWPPSTSGIFSRGRFLDVAAALASRATARRAALRLPSSGSSAATARRRAPPPRREPPARAASRASPARRRSRRAGRRSPRTAPASSAP